MEPKPKGTYSTNNGIRGERPKEYDGENGDEVQGIEQRVSDGHQGGYHRDGERGSEGLSPEDVDAESSWEVKEERSENRGSSRDQDPLVDSIFALQSAQEALEKEVLKLQEISNDGSNDGNVPDLCTEFTDVEQKLQKRSSDGLQHSGGLQSSSGAVQSEVLGRGNRDEETDLEDLFRQKVEAEVEYLAISRTVQNLKIVAVDEITVLEEHKALASEQARILDKLGDAENKASMLKKEAEKLENFCEDIVSADETLNLHKRVCKYGSCFLLQLVLLVVVLGLFVSKLSSNYMEVVPT
ncbi:hypothetical protein CDL12_27890 [Handroanthus impetiginosus]|uniref:Uncharacterized protein n=1 Tax=Handroanthus impetiginosus TaxID=429701 RepID=A0A2G9G390_9LAMI|nr:hypothetical protein CDL12_27890 [Handroanthus impetiginosus]